MPTSLEPGAKLESVLLVDDNPANLRLLSQILCERNYHVRAVTSGTRALASAQMEPPDLILLDIRMPGMDGYQVCQRLKADPATESIPVLFISALDDVGDKMKAFSAGGVDYITKPFQVEEVVARVETHLSLRRLQRRLMEANRRMERELALAAQVQASFLPRSLPSIPGWQLAVSLIPAKQTSGDFWDLITLEGGRLGIVMADVVDKGAGAALYMAMSCTLLRTCLGEHPVRPDLACQAANERLLQYAGGGQFVTVFLGVLEPVSGHLVYCNAGHNPPLLLGPAGQGDLRTLDKTGMALGAVDLETWQAGRVELRSGQRLILYTDGITDAQEPSGALFGRTRLEQAAMGSLGQPAEVVRDSILESVQRFTAGAPQADDMALMVLVREKTF
jgi:sigma-B regulation protein RsbU (phosphoserine phosphatase)